MYPSRSMESTESVDVELSEMGEGELDQKTHTVSTWTPRINVNSREGSRLTSVGESGQ